MATLFLGCLTRWSLKYSPDSSNTASMQENNAALTSITPARMSWTSVALCSTWYGRRGVPWTTLITPRVSNSCRSCSSTRTTSLRAVIDSRHRRRLRRRRGLRRAVMSPTAAAAAAAIKVPARARTRVAAAAAVRTRRPARRLVISSANRISPTSISPTKVSATALTGISTVIANSGKIAISCTIVTMSDVNRDMSSKAVVVEILVSTVGSYL